MIQRSNDAVKKVIERTVRNFIDIYILFKLKEADYLSGYDILTGIHEQYRILVSPGTVYSVLYKLERDGLIESQESLGKRTYKITENGRRKIESIVRSRSTILNLFTQIISSSQQTQ